MAGYKIKNQFHTHYLTLTTVEWVDVFTYPFYKDLIIDSLKHCQKEKGLIIYAYVIISNHIHLIAAAHEGSKGLSQILGDFKQFTSKSIIRHLDKGNDSRRGWLLNAFKFHAKFNPNNLKYQVWQQYNQ